MRAVTRGPGRGPLDRNRIGGLSAAALLLVVACGDPVPTGPSASPSPPTPSASGAASVAPTAGPSLTISIGGDLAGGFSNAAVGADAVRIAGFVHDGLYGLDERLRPVPILASDPPSVSADGLTWTVPMRSGVTFQDGSPVTVDDVIATYELARSPRCRFGPGDCLATVLDNVVAVSDRTVAFVLREPLAGFAAQHLGIGIESAAAIEAAYAKFLAGARAVAVTDTAPYLEFGRCGAGRADRARRTRWAPRRRSRPTARGRRGAPRPGRRSAAGSGGPCQWRDARRDRVRR